MASDPPFSPSVAFGERLRELRTAKEWSQERLALTAGVSLSYVTTLERGQRNPGLDIILRLAHALEVEAGQLVNDLPAPTSKY